MSGVWTVPESMTLVAAFGGVELDFTDAVWEGDEVVLDSVAAFGGIDIKVPDGVEIIDRTVGIFGGIDAKGPKNKRKG